MTGLPSDDAPAAASPVGPPRRCTFPQGARIKRRTEFDRVMKTGRRLSDARLRLWALRNVAGRTRLGLTVGRRHGCAVRRNRLKRIIREAFRLALADLPSGLDLVCSPRAGLDLTLPECDRSLRALVGKAARMLPPGAGEVSGGQRATDPDEQQLPG